MTNEKQKNVLGEVFSLFVWKEKHQPEMRKPFEINGKVYATDARTLIRTDKANIDFEIDNKHTPPNCEGVIPEANTRLILNITKEMFEPLKTEDEYEFEGKYVECETCKVSGEVEWKFEHNIRDFECPVCEGSGYLEQKRFEKTGRKIFGNCAVKLKGAYFNINIFYKLIKVRDILGGEIELLNCSKPRSGFLFKIGVCEILLMPIISADYYFWGGVLNIE